MQQETFWEALTNVSNHRRKVYFQWKNKINNIKVNYGEMTEDEMIKQCQVVNRRPITNKRVFLNYLKRWESSSEYKRLLFLFAEDQFATDLLDVYAKVKESAEKGDSQAIKNMLLLQKEIRNYRESIDKYQELEEEENEDIDDGLII